MNAFERDSRNQFRMYRTAERASRLHERFFSGELHARLHRRKYKKLIRLYERADRLVEIRRAKFAANGYRDARP